MRHSIPGSLPAEPRGARLVWRNGKVWITLRGEKLTYGVMAALQILVLSVEVRILLGQHRLKQPQSIVVDSYFFFDLC